MSVFIDGATLSSLLYSHVNSEGNQEGVLLGQVVRQVKEHISDSQINNSQLHTFTYVASHIPWPSGDRVYSRGGVPFMDRIAALLGDSHTHEEVVGWYSFRRNSTLRMSMKERTLHKHLEAAFCPQHSQQFLFLMCVHSCSSQHSTHSMDHLFATLAPGAGTVKKLSVSVTNLGDTVHTQYQTLAHSATTQSSAVQHILHSYRSQFVSPAGDMLEVEKINDMSVALNKDLQELCQQVSESERQAGELEREVVQLREELSHREEGRLREELSHREEGRLREELSHREEGRLREELSHREEGERRPGVQRGGEKGVYPKLGGGESGEGERPSVDDLLSLAPTVDLCPLPSAPACSLDSAPPDATAPSLLQSVVDTISHVEEEVGGTDTPPQGSSQQCPSDHILTPIVTSTVTPSAGCAAPQSTEPLSHSVLSKAVSGSVLSKAVSGSVLSKAVSGSVHSKVVSGSVHSKAVSGSVLSKAVSGSVQSRVCRGGKAGMSTAVSSSKDHFSFVDNLLTSEGGTAGRKSTATVATGATLTYSPRTTRSHTKGPTPSSCPKDRPKARNSPTRGTAAQLKRGGSPKADGKARAGSPKADGKARAGSAGPGSGDKRRAKVDSGLTEDRTSTNRDSKATKSVGTAGHDAHASIKLDPASCVGGVPKNVCGQGVAGSDSEGEKVDGGPEDAAKNGTLDSLHQDTDAPHSLSPVF
ncbi:uncharacterized protein LOC143293348 [Babylonia areolata]|uniref:uncharacterized protein LOC143293348 n=1 Tax=Babylonia areolata TaxID=304850 RepID=UPI003FD440E2